MHYSGFNLYQYIHEDPIRNEELTTVKMEKTR